MRYLLILLHLLPVRGLAQGYISEAEKTQINLMSDLASHIPAVAHARKKETILVSIWIYKDRL